MWCGMGCMICVAGRVLGVVWYMVYVLCSVWHVSCGVCVGLCSMRGGWCVCCVVCCVYRVPCVVCCMLYGLCRV